MCIRDRSYIQDFASQIFTHIETCISKIDIYSEENKFKNKRRFEIRAYGVGTFSHDDNSESSLQQFSVLKLVKEKWQKYIDNSEVYEYFPLGTRVEMRKISELRKVILVS